ncbi:uncharacterized protein PFL1_03077 [Pseudozyma flocculosa PF-1]|uniref:Related to MLH1 - DNA mismatch repair protein n=2 Tax=Pseudozyma flocculosa TaxID=84751 RepID=A0A5C3F279_9BASI|nr:uncharacterized protein PFL1_03077 [Pseudozyma flocculosa PF-1]EPQ29322.1 hypothetical protein PFL1_03077 [Pseudozyma flocculosa PF-1]SPO37837.1 related to MLH1 - DNA mismatch repair protein [Pseudozyma flocculosa]
MADHDDLDPAAQSSRYRPIKRLEESVVNRIAAGEIIHRPANALKELIENSLDAGATMIKITLKDGGVKLLQIQDNGSGIRHTDLPLLCERFATSKLRDFSDLSKMTTFGFRGEALASISYVSASMSVVSKTKDQDCAYKAYYSSGALAPPKPGQSSAPRQCAGTDGTLISAEDLFFNVPQRRRALKSGADEYNRALDVAAKYAVHYGGRGIGFSCRKAGSNVTDLNTPASATNTTLDAIRMLHGNAVARELIELKPMEDERYAFRCQGWISGANWSSKRSTMLCFINNRLVDCPLLKRSLEALYATLLPKGGHPWIYISLDIRPENVDVNVHPTKKEVHFLDEEEIVEAICVHAQTCLAGANASRTFQFSQALLPGAPDPSRPIKSRDRDRDEAGNRAPDGQETPYDDQERRDALDDAVSASTTTPVGAKRAVAFADKSLPPSLQKGYPQHMVRVDARSRTLDSMFGSSSSLQQQPPSLRNSKRQVDAAMSTDAPTVDGEKDQPSSHLDDSSAIEDGAGVRPSGRKKRRTTRIPESDIALTSVRELRAEIQKRRHGGLADIVHNHSFVGVADLDRSLSLLQHETRLYLVGHAAFIEEFAYQLVIRQFGSLKRIKLDPPPSIEELIRIGLDCEPDVPVKGPDREQMVKKIASTLIEHAEMLDEYFSLGIDAEAGTLLSIPTLLPPTHTTTASRGDADEPGNDAGSEATMAGTISLERLPAFLARLGPMVDWEDEKACFETFARELAFACLPDTPLPLAPDNQGGGERNEDDGDEAAAAAARAEHRRLREKTKWEVQHRWFASMVASVGRFAPPKSLLDRDVVQVANLPDLYRVFERC